MSCHCLRGPRSMRVACMGTVRRGCGANPAAVPHTRPTGVGPTQAGPTPASADAGNAWGHDFWHAAALQYARPPPMKTGAPAIGSQHAAHGALHRSAAALTLLGEGEDPLCGMAMKRADPASELPCDQSEGRGRAKVSSEGVGFWCRRSSDRGRRRVSERGFARRCIRERDLLHEQNRDRRGRGWC